MSVVESFCASVPKIELHLHLVGSASPETVAELAARSPDTRVPDDPDALRTLYEFRDFEHFIGVYQLVNALVTTGEDIVTLLVGAARELAAQNVRYAEMTVTPFKHALAGIPYGDVVEGLAEGRAEARRLGLDFAWIYDIPGEDGQQGAEATLDWALNSPPDGLVGFGLAGAEAGVERRDYAWAFDKARAAGLRSVPHAGEGDGPASVWGAITALKADRIGHGVRAAEDPVLVDHLVETQIPLEVCPSSNVCTRVFDSLEEHSIGALLEAGAFVTLNTDDPPMFNTTLVDEYQRVATTLGLDVDAVAGLARNAVTASFASPTDKERWLSEIDAATAATR